MDWEYYEFLKEATKNKTIWRMNWEYELSLEMVYGFPVTRTV